MPKKVIPIIMHDEKRLSRSPTLPQDLTYPIEVKSKYPYKPNNTCVVGFYVFHKCNARCDYCFWFRDIDFSEQLTEERYKRIIDEVAKRPDATLLFLGGEPTMSKMLPEMIEYAAASDIKEVAIGTNFLRPLDYFLNLPRLDKVRINMSIHMDIFKEKSDAELDQFIDKIIDFYNAGPGKYMRIGVIFDERYVDRLLHLLTRIEHLDVMKYPVIPITDDFHYYKVSQENIDKLKSFFHPAFYKYKINAEERDWLDDSVHDMPVFTGYWCNANSLEIFADGTTRITCLDKIVGNVLTEDDVVKNYNPLTRCTVPLCDNFNRVLLKKHKYGKYT